MIKFTKRNRFKIAAASCLTAAMIFSSAAALPAAYAADTEDSEIALSQSENAYDLGKFGVTELGEEKPMSLGKIISMIFGKSYSDAYALYVDGAETGLTAAQSTIYEVLSDITDEYSSEKTSSAAFKEKLEVSPVTEEDEKLLSYADLKNQLNLGNTVSEFSLTVETTEITQRTVSVPYETVYVDDEALYIGDAQVKTEGENGTATETVSTVFENGRQISSSVVSTVNIVSPVDKIISVGTTERPATASYGTYIWPTTGNMTSDFGPRNVYVGSSNHKGIDICGNYAQDICAADGGEVIYSDWMRGYGYIVQIQHDNGDVTYYAHCSELLVSVGERVAQNQRIALMGDTGTATAIHLHFEIRVDGEAVDPLIYLP